MLVLSAVDSGSNKPDGVQQLKAAVIATESQAFSGDLGRLLDQLRAERIDLRRQPVALPEVRRKRSRLIQPFVRKHASTLKLVDEALTKGIRSPLDQVDQLNQGRRLRNLVQLLCFDAEVRIYGGRSDLATQRLRAGLEIGRSQLGFRPSLEEMGLQAMAMALTAIDRWKHDLSAQDWSKLRTRAEQYLDRRFSLIPVLEHCLQALAQAEKRYRPAKSSLEALVTIDASRHEDRAPPPIFKSMSEAEATKIVRRGIDSSARRLRRQIEILKGAESTWWATMNAEWPGHFNKLKAETDADIIRVVADDASVEVIPLLQNTMMVRTQMRLVSLMASVHQFKLRGGSYPKALAQCCPKEQLRDPFSNQPFGYRLLPNGEYDLFSHGTRSTGRIQLRYQPTFSIART